MNEYNTNILKLTCSCPDWKETRQQYKFNDPRRLCKHIINKLDINNLPVEISKFRESIEFYQKKEWGFKRDFNKIIELGTFTLLGDIDWIDVYDKNGIRYGVKKEPFSKNVYWANNQKPKNFSILEDFLVKTSKKIPLPLEEEEYPQIISFIKKVLPHKKDLFISIHDSEYIPDSDGIIYHIWESKLTPEQEEKLRQELLQKHKENEAYYILSEATKTPLGDEHEFSIYEALVVKNNKIIVKMDSGKKYTLARDFEYVNQLKEKRESKEKERERLWQEELVKYEKERQEKLEKDRKIAQEKGYMLTRDFKGKLYDIQDIYNHPNELPWEEHEKIKKSILDSYDTLQNLIKKYSLNISTAQFNRALKNLDFIVKDSSLNLNNWIIKNDGLNYGINLIKDSKYMHEDIPDWYKVHIFDKTKMELINLESTVNIKMTSALFKRNKFNELYQLVKPGIKNSQLHNKIINKTTSNKKVEREKWLRHVECPNCGEKTHIHKKDKRKRKTGYIQRFYCNTCNSIFQMDVEKLEQTMKDYEKDELNKENLIITQKERDIQSFEKEELEPIKIDQNEEKEKSLFKKLFSIFK